MVKRLLLMAQKHRQENFLNKWRPIILNDLQSIPDSLKVIAKKDMKTFLILWNHLQETLRGDAKEQLNSLARSLKINLVAINMLSSRKISNHLLAISVLGNLKEESAWDKIEKYVNHKNIILSMTAVNALARINPQKSLHVVIPFIVQRDNWPEYKIANILYEIGAKTFSKPLAEAILDVSSEKQVRLLSLMRFADGAVVVPLARELIRETLNNEVVSASINLLGLYSDRRDAPLIKSFLKHPVSFVRIRAVSALVNIANADDLEALENCLRDSEWWVRYRTAQVIASMPYMTRELMEKIRDRQTDRFAVDILNTILSEKMG